MTSQTVAQLALELAKSQDILLEQFRNAGLAKTSAKDRITEEDKRHLLNYLKAMHSTSGTERKKITLVKKGTIETRKADALNKSRTIAVEVRKKPTFIELTDPEPSDESTPVQSNMKFRLHRIEATAFKAFRSLDFNLNGRHLLAYGGNGAGKSSLYWLLYTFFQSGQKNVEDIEKYFDPDNPKNLINLHADTAEKSQSFVRLTLRDTNGHDVAYAISSDKHETHNVPLITKANMASDFVTYRILSDFYRFRHSQHIDLWNVFESEMLPFCYAPSSPQSHLGKAWQDIKEEQDRLKTAGRIRATKLAEFEAVVENFSQGVTEAIASISREAQAFYNKHFAQDDAVSVSILIGVTKAGDYDHQTKHLEPPQIGFEVAIGEKRLAAPHTFLNEAKLTQLALAVRFGATLALLRESPMKLLVLDDLLVSLDMDNRMKVVDVILGETFEDYQRVILTHDRGFYQEFKRRIGNSHADWSFQCLKGQSNEKIDFVADKTDLQKAEDYLAGYDLEEAAVYLRKAAEASARNLRELWKGKKLPPGEFFSLTENLKFAKNKLQEKLPRLLFEKILKGTPKEYRNFLLAPNDADLDNNTALDAATKGILKGQRKRLKKLFNDEAWATMDTLALVDDLLAMTNRVLNPAAHGNEVPLYQEEVERALAIVRQFGSIP